MSATDDASKFNGGYYFARPMQSRIDLNQDVTYGLPRHRYFEAMGWEEKLDSKGDLQQLDKAVHEN